MGRVLVIDDDVAIAELLRVVLEDAGCEVVRSYGGDLPSGPFDCIVTDLVNVDLYTRESARDWVLRVGARYPDTPIVVVTAHIEARDEPSLGARIVIMKPFDIEALVKAVRETAMR